MIIVDPSVLLSPYVLTILRDVDPSDTAIAETLHYAVGGIRGSFPALARFYGLDPSRADALRKWIYRYPKECWQKDWTIVKPPGDEVGAAIFKHLGQLCGQLVTEEEKVTIPILLEQIWGASANEWPILTLGSPIPTLWEDIQKLFPKQTSKRDLGLIMADPIAEFRKLGIPMVAVTELRPWFIEVLAPSPTMIEYLRPGEFLRKLKFVAFSIERGNSDESLD